MTRQQLFNEIIRKKSFLCVGLDTDLDLIPKHLLSHPDPVFEFNRQIIDATAHIAVAFKPNIAFYEAMGIDGWKSLEKTVRYLNENYPQCFTIADAKRGDIGNTTKMYAKAFFKELNFDAITVAPYMGSDSVKPFLEYEGKWVILLGLTSNKGSEDFQFDELNGKKLYERVIEKAQQWGTAHQLMFVVGATHPDQFAAIRTLAPDYFFLVPGVGAQRGSIEAVCRNGMNDFGGLLINSSREILYASNGVDFAQAAEKIAMETAKPMKQFIDERLLQSE